MRNRWYLLLSLLMLVLVPHLAAAAPSLTIGTVVSTAGSNATVNVTLSNNGGAPTASTIALEIGYNPTRVSANPTAAIGAAATAAGKSIASSVSSVNASLSTLNISISGGETAIADGVIATLTFPLGTGTGYTMPITFNTAPDVSDANATTVAGVTATNGSVSVADGTAPTVDTFTIASTSTSTTIPVTAFTASDNVAVTGYLVTQSSTAPAASATGWSTTAPTSFVATGTFPVGVATNVTLFGWAKDAAGNVSASRSAVVAVTTPDTTAPTVTGITIPATATSLTVAVSGFAATDNVGVTGYLLTESSTAPAASATGWSATAPTSFTFAAGGARTLFAWAKDAAGNVSAAVSRNITITLPDAVAPTVTAFTIPATATSLTVPVTSFTGNDNIAVTGYLVTESSTAPAASAAGWSASAPTSYTVTGNVPQGVASNVTLFGWVKDAAGNVSASVSGVVALTLPDTTKPVVDTFTVPATATTATVSVTGFTASDNLAVTGYLITESATEPAASATGWVSQAPASYSFTGLPQGTTDKTLFAWAKDAAGNVSVSRSAAVSITLTGPTLTFNNMLANGAVTKNPALNIAGTVSGNGTALASLTLAVNGGEAQALTFNETTGAFSTAVTLAEGANSIVIAATDANNNVTTDTRSITLNPNAADLAVTAPVNSSFVRSSLVDVTGTVGSPQTTTLTIALNGGEAQSVALNGGSDFVYQLTLAEGVNNIVVVATEPGVAPHTQQVQVTFDPSAPTLAVTAPADAFATAKSSVLLSGTVSDSLTTPAIAVTVDGVALTSQPVVADGAFSVTIDLPTVKTYAIAVTATDQSGNSATVNRNVIRKDPSGNAADGVSTPTVADVQKVLQFALGLGTLNSDERINVDVAPLVDGKPAPDGNVDGGDALVILEKIVGLVSWQ